ncbi:MAG: DegT/DnrJ/EryC1/StrS family aminotransferase [bacterium]|nr:DegT/DnrJ/EryC1/StrS family aminotransferase [bacterium]
MEDIETLNKDIDEVMKKLCRHDYVHLTDRGNSAIFLAMHIAKKTNPKQDILIPDQGGWFSYKGYPHFFDLNIVEVKTNYGVIDLDDLKEKAKNASAIIFSSFAGYFAEQPLDKISNICKEAGCLVIEDASGAIGDAILCNGKYSDIIVGSFGKWKPVECGYGGWISMNSKEFFGVAKDAMSITKVHPQFYNEIGDALKKNKMNKLLALQIQVKEELKDFEVLHREKRGLNVVVKFDPGVLEYCQEKNYPYVLCPSYIRVNEKAISIELKRLNF